MLLENVWSALSVDGWKSAETVQERAGIDADTFRRVIGFLVRWNFIETRKSPSLQVRRRSGTISPVDVASLLQSVTGQPGLSPTKMQGNLAERVACRACGGRSFSFLGENQVECKGCGEKQWFTIRIDEKQELEACAVRPRLFRNLLLRLGLPQQAFVRNIPKPTRFYWFRCLVCKKNSTDYFHGHSRILRCQFCRTENAF